MEVLRPYPGRLLLLAAAGLACGDPAGSDGWGLPTAATIRVEAGSGQASAAGGWVAQPLQALVSAAEGTPVARARVAWDVTAGQGATLSDGVTVSDGNGIAQVFIRLGRVAGVYRVRARLEGAPQLAVLFDLTATSGPRLDGVDPPTFTGGDTVVLRGAGLDDGVRVEIAGGLAPLMGRDPNGERVTVTVPWCRPAGPATVRAGVGSAWSNDVAVTYQNATGPVVLAAATYFTAAPDTDAACWTLPQAGLAGAEYLVTLRGAPAAGDVTFRFASADVPVTAVPPAAVAATLEPSWRLRFENRLRAVEQALARRPRRAVPARPPGVPAAAAAPPITAGDRRTFRVCAVVTCETLDQFPVVEAEAHYVGDRAIIYQDLDSPPEGYRREDLAAIGALFDGVLYHAETGIFGAESDVDQNGRVMILFTPVVNGLTPKLGVSCALGYVTGFYYALDVDPAFAADPRSNQAEVLYVMVADSAGTFSCPHSREVAERRGLVTVVHELQHMINFYQHVLVRGGEREDTWLNEGLSHLAEDLVGSALGATGDPRAPAFSDGNLSNAYGFLRRPQETAPVYSAGAGQPEQRGATWLLLRWVAERFGYAAVRRLTETSLVGLDNLAAVAGLSADALLSEWGLANYVADLAGFEAPPALQYGSWPLRAHFAALHAGNPQRFDRVFPLVPLAVSAQGFSVVGTVTAGAPAYYRVVQGPSGGSVALRLTQEDGSALPAASRPTVTVLRVW